MESRSNINDFSYNLREMRRKKGYTQAELAKISGVSRRAIVHYEKYANRPSIDKVKKLADALETSDDELLGIKRKSKSKKNKSEDVSYKIMKKVRIIEKLPLRDQNAIFRLINSLAEKNKISEG
jgi:transcriptional regulator with XRE-family HTH domain